MEGGRRLLVAGPGGRAAWLSRFMLRASAHELCSGWRSGLQGVTSVSAVCVCAGQGQRCASGGGERCLRGEGTRRGEERVGVLVGLGRPSVDAAVRIQSWWAVGGEGKCSETEVHGMEMGAGSWECGGGINAVRPAAPDMPAAGGRVAPVVWYCGPTFFWLLRCAMLGRPRMLILVMDQPWPWARPPAKSRCDM